MLRLGKQGETDRLGNQIVAALHDKGRRVVRPLGHACIRADAFRARARASASVRIGVDPSVLGRMWCLLGKVSQGRVRPLYLLSAQPHNGQVPARVLYLRVSHSRMLPLQLRSTRPTRWISHPTSRPRSALTKRRKCAWTPALCRSTKAHQPRMYPSLI